MSIKKIGSLASLFAALSLLAAPAAAQAPDKPWMLRTTAIGIFPDADDDFTNDFDIEDQFDFAVDLTYFFTPQFAVNVLATHTNVEVESNAACGGSCGSVDLLPPIFTAQWHFLPTGEVRPYVGAGFNYNVFSNESGTLDAINADVDDEFGLVAEIGADLDLGNGLFLNGNIKYIDLEVDVDSDVGDFDLEVNPLIVGTGIGYRF